MTKILVLSDSHGNVNNMKKAVEEVKPDMIIHLGDCYPDGQRLKAAYPDIPFEGVPGNCDCTMADAEKLLTIEGKRFLICHGHTYNVKSSYLRIDMAGSEKGADVILFGHTHKAYCDLNNGHILLNPGSVGSPGWLSRPTYAVITVDEASGNIHYETAYLE